MPRFMPSADLTAKVGTVSDASVDSFVRTYCLFRENSVRGRFQLNGALGEDRFLCHFCYIRRN